MPQLWHRPWTSGAGDAAPLALTLCTEEHPGLHPTHLRECTLTDDGHERVEVANVEALSGHADEELDHLGSPLLLGRLGTEHLGLSDDRSPSDPDDTPCSPRQSLLMAEMCDLASLWPEGAGSQAHPWQASPPLGRGGYRSHSGREAPLPPGSAPVPPPEAESTLLASPPCRRLTVHRQGCRLGFTQVSSAGPAAGTLGPTLCSAQTDRSRSGPPPRCAFVPLCPSQGSAGDSTVGLLGASDRKLPPADASQGNFSSDRSCPCPILRL